MNDLIREVMTFARADLRHHGITVRTELAEDLPRISAVRIQLQQVLLNLIANAVESMASIEDHARVLTVRSQKADGHGIVVTVEDTGIGIDQTDVERVFEAFVSTKPEGMGMGLSICRSIVEAHGGRISVSTARPADRCFRSVCQVTSRANAHEVRMKERHTPEPVVFVIDDDASVRDSLKNLLETVGLHAELFDIGAGLLEFRTADVQVVLFWM